MIPFTLVDFSGEVNEPTNWDMALILDMLTSATWQAAQGYQFEYRSPSDCKDGAVVLIPARQNAGYEEAIYDYLCSIEWSLVILIGDEEQSFDIEAIKMPKTKIWLMHPTLEREADFYIGSGYAPHLRENLAQAYEEYLEKPFDWFFSGQNNHPRRHEAVKVLERMIHREDLKGLVVTSEGFTQGQIPPVYALNMAKAKAVPALSGIQVPDSFRLYEALEAGAVPVADDLSSVLVHEAGYWKKIFGDFGVPFKVFDDIANLEGYICDVQREYPAINNRVYSWWQNVKRGMVYKLNEHVHELSGLDYPTNEIRNKITVLIVTSPIKSHPDTKIIDQTIHDIRECLPESEIIIGIDGVRAEQEDYRERYEEYVKRLLWKCNFEYRNVLPVRFEEHMHQAAMTRQLLKLVKTPTILFVEHDTALTADYKDEFDWLKLVETIESGQAYMIRFNHEALILPEHEHLMLGGPEDVSGVRMRKTVQWSQRPHLASTAFYKDMIDRYFSEDSRTMIEDVVHGKLLDDYNVDGLQGWYKWRVWVYTPDTDNIKRSYTTDGRGDDPKYEMVF